MTPRDLSTLLNENLFLKCANVLRKRYSVSEHDAEDCVQEACERAISHIQFYDPTKSFESWFIQIACNSYLNAFGKNSRVIYDTEKLVLLDLAEDESSEIGMRDDLEKMHNCLKQIPEDQAALLSSRYLLSKTYRQISQETKTPIATLYSRLSTALTSLRNLMMRPQIAA